MIFFVCYNPIKGNLLFLKSSKGVFGTGEETQVTSKSTSMELKCNEKIIQIHKLTSRSVLLPVVNAVDEMQLVNSCSHHLFYLAIGFMDCRIFLR